MKIQAACTQPQSSSSYIHFVQSPRCGYREEQGRLPVTSCQKTKTASPAGLTGKKGLRECDGLLFSTQCRRNNLATLKLNQAAFSSNWNIPAPVSIGAKKKHQPLFQLPRDWWRAHLQTWQTSYGWPHCEVQCRFFPNLVFSSAQPEVRAPPLPFPRNCQLSLRSSHGKEVGKHSPNCKTKYHLFFWPWTSGAKRGPKPQSVYEKSKESHHKFTNYH